MGAIKFKLAFVVLIVAACCLQGNEAKPKPIALPAWYHDVARAITGAVTTAGKKIEQGFNSVKKAVSGAVDSAGRGITRGYKSVEAAFGLAGKEIEKTYNKVADAVEDVVDDAGREITKGYKTVEKLVNQAGKEIEKGYDVVADAVKDAGKEIETAVTVAGRRIEATYGIMSKSVSEAIDDAGRFFDNAGKSIVRSYKSVVEFIDDAVDTIKDAASSLKYIVDEITEVAARAMDQKELSDKIIYVIDAIEERVQRIQDLFNEAVASAEEGVDDPAFAMINKFVGKISGMVSKATGLKEETSQCAVEEVGLLLKTVARDGFQCITDAISEAAEILRSIVGLIPKAKALYAHFQETVRVCKTGSGCWRRSFATLMQAVVLAKDGAIYFAQGALFITGFKFTIGICGAGVVANAGSRIKELTETLPMCMQLENGPLQIEGETMR